jgi:UDP-glucose 4-epimerase
VYGQPDQLPVTENSPVKRLYQPYGKTKQISGKISEILSIQGPPQGNILRYFNPIGAHPSASSANSPWVCQNNLVTFITQTAAGIRKENCWYSATIILHPDENCH